MTEQSTSPHLDLDALADTLAGEGDDATAAHLSSCSSCASRLAELTAAETRVTAALSALPAPALPDGLADRLAAALAAEAPLTAQPSSTVTPLSSRAPKRRWLPAAAAAVLLASGAGIGYAVLEGSGEQADSADGLSALVLNASGTDYGDGAAVAAVLPEVLQGTAGTGEVFTRQSAPEAGAMSDSAGATTESEPGAAAKTESDAALTAQGPAADAPAAGTLADEPLARLRTTDGLAECLSALVPPDEPDLQPLALDYAQFQGMPALAVVLPDPDPAKVSVYVVGPACAQGNEDLLTFLRVDAP